MFLAIRDNVHRLCKLAGCCNAEQAMSDCGGGSSWQMIACLDRLVELGEIRELKYGECWGQHRIFQLVKQEA